ncbi:LOW QUALITY PROTEIN: uncharacterized protein LOC112592227 [Melanaphis sacchari]|uniref:LOW QUALITY PROTEIN: uncharacterized protein LOC112592227 n=1 Tax=Melanaphis sacchari TaxID=742174 RepID=UPI000DC15104|nr:LOW QUALITY PROTEIN: uncharacterized protein LOC112592227 [Melanaphis sacchari]
MDNTVPAACEYIFKRNDGLSDRDDLGGILCLDSDDECEKNKLDGPDVIEATDSSNSDEGTINEVPTRNGKKIKANPSIWKRNVVKKQRAAGEEYTSIYTNKVVPKRVTGPACKCIYKCFSKITDTDKSSIINAFNAIGNKEKQDTFLCGLNSVNNVQRRRPLVKGTPEIKKSVSCTYKIRLTTNELIVCKIAFCSLFGIGKSLVDRLIHNIKNNKPSPQDLRGKHLKRPNKISNDIIFKIDAHINSFPKVQSHYSRSDNLNVHYLSPELNISKMYKLYLEKNDPEVFEMIQKGETNIKPIVKYDYFSEYFKNNFNLTFGTPKTDTCQTCDRLKNLIDHETNLEIKRQFEVEKEVHIRKAEVFYTDLKSFVQKSKLDEEIELLSFDFQQNMPLPHIPCGDVFYKRQIWVYNFCIYSGKTGKSYHYMYDELTGKKGQNDVISFIDHFLKNLLTPGVKHLYIFTDNCSSQNKNNALFQYLYTVVQSKCFNLESITHRYPEPGHSFLPCDRCFGLIEKVKRKHERIYLPESYKEIVKKTSKKFNVIDVSRDMILNFSDYTKPLYKKIVKSVEDQKFSIMAYRCMEYKKEGLFCSIYGNSIGFEKFQLQKKSAILKFPEENLPLLHPEVLKIKDAKFRDVQDLAAKYVPPENLWFYNNLVVEAE